MRRSRTISAVVLSLALVGLGPACGDDDGGDVRNVGEDCPSGSASGSGSATGAASGTASGSGPASGSEAHTGSASGSATGC